MSGEEVRKFLSDNGCKLVDVAESMGTIPQNLQGFLKVNDIKTVVLERIAAAINKDVLFFYKQDSGNTVIGGHQSIAGNGNTISGNVNVTLPETGYQKIIRSDGSQTVVEMASANRDIELSHDLTAENLALHKENSELKNKIIELQARLLEVR